MPRSLNIIDLAITEDVSHDAAEVARRLDEAADLIEEFAADTALDAMDALLAAVSHRDALETTRRLAKETSQQSEILHSEIERFLAVSAGQRTN